MKSRSFSFFSAGLLTAGLLIFSGSCVFSPGPGPAGRLISRTDCKSAGGLGAGAARTVRAANEECIDYDYDGRSVLRLKHVNAGFNCCPGTVSADILTSGGEILIKEKESSSLCDCNCLYDIDYEFVGIPPGSYRLSVVGPYQIEGDAPLEFLLDLAGSASGSFCVERTHYPWSI